MSYFLLLHAVCLAESIQADFLRSFVCVSDVSEPLM